MSLTASPDLCHPCFRSVTEVSSHFPNLWLGLLMAATAGAATSGRNEVFFFLHVVFHMEMRFGKNFSNLEPRKLTTHDVGATVICVQWSYADLLGVCPFFRSRHTLYFLVQFKWCWDVKQRVIHILFYYLLKHYVWLFIKEKSSSVGEISVTMGTIISCGFLVSKKIL